MSEGKHTLNEQEIENLKLGRVLPALKMFRQRTGLDLKPAKEIVDRYRTQKNLLAEMQNNRRTVEVHDQLVEALRKGCHVLRRIPASISRQQEGAMNQALVQMNEALKAAGEEAK